ncbi:nuclear pore complex protein Nup50 isoform X1 [Cynoglossus semilaevis]|uniref:Nuclear pore complex protein Nup50 n=1 Tax=Cynoglossus semilaevis TaxID=244447 RepID=A0A3P8UZN0_CYNSE|nr:nuclear pore complex protein Nup50 isoform X1 [Cynoglossus semilaevis]
MAKRIADKELTDRNWDQEEEGEEAGTFSVASHDVLKNRAIKKAKRRNVGSEGDGNTAFKGFKGFSLATSEASAASTTPIFSAFGNGGTFKGFGDLTNGTSAAPSFEGFSSTTSTTAPTGLTLNSSSTSNASADVTTKQTNGSCYGLTQSPSSSNSNGNSKEYSRQLTALNCSVRDWITKHVNDNPLCDLQPIFKDYERHLASIERQYGSGAGVSEEKKQEVKLPAAAAASSSSPKSATPSLLSPSSSNSGSSALSSAPAPNTSLFSLGKKTGEDSDSTSTPIPAGVTFNFGQKVDSSVLGTLGSKPGFSFSNSSTSQKSLFGSSGSPAPLSFSATKSEDAAGENADEESEEPPKPEVKEVKEEDAFYSKKCKLFYKKDSEFKEKGVGTLHLKEMTDGKTQMIIRADTNLGNILLNIIIQSSMPCSRLGKNNVMVVCAPNPPIDEKNPNNPIPLLIRVKTAEDADELHKTLEEKKR